MLLPHITLHCSSVPNKGHVPCLYTILSDVIQLCSGMYWPAQILQDEGSKLLVSYDNGDQDWVQEEDLQPTSAPVTHGREKKPLQRGEFVEVHNNSDTDPAEWVGLIKKTGKNSHTVSDDHSLKHTGRWKLCA